MKTIKIRRDINASWFFESHNSEEVFSYKIPLDYSYISRKDIILLESSDWYIRFICPYKLVGLLFNKRIKEYEKNKNKKI